MFQCAVTFNLNEFVFLAPLWGACPCIQVNLWQQCCTFVLSCGLLPLQVHLPTLSENLCIKCIKVKMFTSPLNTSEVELCNKARNGLLLLQWDHQCKLNTSEEVELCPKITQAAWIQMHQSSSTPLGRNLKYDLIYNGMLENEMCSSVWMMVSIGHTNLMPVRRVV